jgi:RNA polymerase sigma-70 factor, ECF subfamily
MNKKNYEELFIFNRMAEGDKEAFRFFFEKYYTGLCNLVNIYIHDPVMSEEIVQDIYIYFWERKKDISIETSVRSYLFRASKNKSLNYIRNEKTKLAIQERLMKMSYTDHEMPDKILDAAQLREIIETSVNTLPKKCREIYILGKEKNFSYNEIAKELDISVKTVENQMGKALKKLRELLMPYYREIFMFLIGGIIL